MKRGVFLFVRCNAKYLWKRIPANVKSSNAELAQIWAVGQNMWQRDLPAVYKTLNSTTWSEHVTDIMKAVQGMINNLFINLRRNYNLHPSR